MLFCLYGFIVIVIMLGKLHKYISSKDIHFGSQQKWVKVSADGL